MIGFAEYRQSATTITLQVVAVRFEDGTELHHIVEHLLYDEMNGKVQRMLREAVVDYISKSGVGSVITRNPYGKKVDVIPERVGSRVWLRTRPDDEFDDNLYSLYRFDRPNATMSTFHAVATRYTTERDPSHLEDLIVFSDAAGTAEVLSRSTLVERITAAPGSYFVETPRIPRTALVVDASGRMPIVRSQPGTTREDLLFQLPRHHGNIMEMI